MYEAPKDRIMGVLEKVKLKDKFESQKREFDAVKVLLERYNVLTFTPIVDDDYLEVRHRYESAMRELIIAIRENGRIP